MIQTAVHKRYSSRYICRVLSIPLDKQCPTMFLEKQYLNQKNGWIEVICGSMFSGKTEELIRRIKRAEFAQQQFRLFKPHSDQRYSENNVVSHDNNSMESITVRHSRELLELSENCEVIGIDEAQFFDFELPDICNRIANRGVRVIVAGLDLDYMGRPFGPMPNLLAMAEFVTKVHAICVKTGTLAQFSFRLDDNDELIQLGEKEAYLPLSRNAYHDAMTKKNEAMKLEEKAQEKRAVHPIFSAQQ